MSSPSPAAPIPCPACGAPSTGRYCAECGAAVREAACGACRTILSPGARFCHRCGTPVGATATATPLTGATPTGSAPVHSATGTARRAAGARTASAGGGSGNRLLWAIGGLAFVVVVVILAAQRAGDAPPTPGGLGPAPTGAGQRAPDISAMSPRERASVLFDRVMRYDSEGKQDSVRAFAPMALAAHEMVGAFDIDLRYDYGRVAEVSGDLDLAAAQADTILREAPDHLLGLVLSWRVAQARGDRGRADSLARRLLAVKDAQLARGLEEYQLHKGDIDAALAAAQR